MNGIHEMSFGVLLALPLLDLSSTCFISTRESDATHENDEITSAAGMVFLPGVTRFFPLLSFELFLQGIWFTFAFYFPHCKSH